MGTADARLDVKGAYYNEKDKGAAAWLRTLILFGHIAPGDVDERSIEDVRPDDLRDYVQCHFFAGIGVWSAALRGAGWGDDRPVWTGSCPCQPFSEAGENAGFDDERHLWPAWHWLISQCRPNVVFGEQVASKPGLAWFDLVSADLEGTGYACGANDLCAAGVGAPHRRQRLYFVAHHDAEGRGVGAPARLHGDGPPGNDADRRGANGDVAHAEDGRRGAGRNAGPRFLDAPELGGSRPARLALVNAASEQAGLSGRARLAGSPLADDASERRQRRPGVREAAVPQRGVRAERDRRRGYWADVDWVLCRDGKRRPVEPGTFPLAHGAPARVGRLRGYGNAIVKDLAQAFIEEAMTLL